MSESSSSSGTRPTWAFQTCACERAAAGQADLTAAAAVRVAQQARWAGRGVEDRVVLLLPAVGGQRLPEVPAPVEQADPDDRHAEVAGRLQVVAGQDAEAAGVLRQHLR